MLWVTSQYKLFRKGELLEYSDIYKSSKVQGSSCRTLASSKHIYKSRRLINFS